MRKIILAAAALATAIAAAVVWLSPSKPNAPAAATSPTAGAFDAAETFLRHLRDGAYDKAYAMARPELSDKITTANFRTEVSIFERVGMQSVTWSPAATKYEFMVADTKKGVRWNVYEAEFTGELAARGGKATLKFRWINDDGTWRLLAFRWDSAPEQPSRAQTSPVQTSSVQTRQAR